MRNVRKISKKYYLRQIVAYFLVYCLFFNTSVVLAVDPPGDTALPSYTSGNYAVGAGGISDIVLDGSNMTIESVANGTVIYINNHDIGSLASVTYNQVTDGWALVKINDTFDGTFYGDNAATRIFGNLTATDNFIISNIEGIYSAPDSFIQARNLVLSGMRISDTDFGQFVNGDIEDLKFNTQFEYDGFVTIDGRISGAESVYIAAKNITNLGTISSPGGCVVMAAGDSAVIGRPGSEVVVQVAMADPANHVIDNDGTIDATGGKVILAAGDIWSTAIEGVESLRAEATRNITLEGAATATGDIALIADADLQYGGDVTTNGVVNSEGGNVDIAGNLIELNEDVIAGGGDLTITGRTSEGLILDEIFQGPEPEGFGPEKYWGYIDVAATENPEGTKLYASHDVILKDAFGSGGDEPPAGEMDLFGHGSLTIEAAGGSIQTDGPFGEGVKITVENSSPAYLAMVQSDPLNLADYSFGNQNNTDLYLQSSNGSVTAVDSSQPLSGKNENAADQWLSIEAHARTDITLQGHDASRDITARTLASYAGGFDTGNITVTSDNSKVLLTENVRANQGSVAITAIDGGIVSSGHITASDGITLFGEVTADASVDQIFDAGNGTLWAKDTLSTITKGTGKLTLAGDTLVDLDGVDGSSGDSVDVQDGALTIDGPVDAEGNLRATGVIQITGPAQLAGDVLSTGSGIIYQDDVDADGIGSQVFDAGSGQLIAENGVDIDKSTAGSLTLAGDTGIVLGGNATGTGMTAADSLIFENNVTADGTGDAEDQRFDAGLGAMDADGSIAKTSDGKLNLGGDEGIELGGNVETHDGDLTFEDAVTANGGNQILDADGTGKDLIADDDIIKNTPGSLTLGAGTQPDAQIELAGDVTTTDGDLIFWDKVIADGTGNQVFDADGTGTDLIADDDIIKTTAGNLTLGAGTQPDAQIELPGDVMTTDGDLTLWDQVIANGSGSQRFDAVGGKLWATDTITKTDTGSGDLNLGGDEAIDLDGTVDVQTTAGSLTIEDDFTAAADLIASENVTLEGSATLDGGDSGPPEVRVDQRIRAENGQLKATGWIHKTEPGNLNIFGGYNGPLYPDMDYSVHTQDVIVDKGELSIAGNATVRLDGSIYSKENMTLASNVDGIASTPSSPGTGSPEVSYDYLVHYNGTIQSLNGNVDISAQNSFIALDGGNNMPDAYVSAGGDILLRDSTWIQYSNKLDAGHNVEAFSTLHGNGSLTVEADEDIMLKANVSSVGAMTMVAGSDIELNRNSGNTSSESTISLNAGDSISVGRPFSGEGNVTANGNMDIIAGTDSGDNVKVLGKLTTTNGGNINVEAGGDIKLYGTFNGPYFESAEADGDLTLDAEYDVDVLGDLISNNGSIDIYSSDDTTYLGGDVFAAYDVTLHNNTILDGGDSQIIEAGLVGNGTMTAGGWLWKTTPGHLYLGGYNSDPGHRDGKAIDLQYAGCLPAASTCLGNLDLYAPDGDIQISGDLTTFGLCDFDNRVESVENGYGSCIDEWYDRPTGGVSVIAENGKIYTDADSPDPAAGDYMLNIGIVGNSDDVSHRMVPDNGYEYIQIGMPQLGVDLPWGEEGKAAIVVLSREDLKFGPDTMLIAKGLYDSSVVDDRPGVGFLADPLTSIGGIIRDEGDPIDVAIYAGSMGTEEGQGNVHLDGRAIDVAENGTMVVDAYDTVTFGDFETFNLEDFQGCEDLGCFLIKLALRFHDDIDFEDLCAAFGTFYDEYEGDNLLEDFLNDYFDEGFFFNIGRLEVVSRLTEWLFEADAFGTLPYPYNPEIVEAFIGGEYVLRGAGLGNPDILDGRAWVLEDPLDPAPLYEEAGEAAEEEAFGEGGCPALMDWLAIEIGIPAEDIQVTLAGALALNTDVQPCEMCARLKDAATTMEDADGTRIAAMARVVNEFVTTPAPPSPEQMTQIAAALSEHVGDGTYYALAGEWIDALVAYVGIMNTEMGYSASDAAAFAKKYLTPVTETGNVALNAYVQARLAALGG